MTSSPDSTTDSTAPWQAVSQPLKWLCLTAIAIGLFFRATHLDRKFYWGDEVRTSMRVSGYTETQVVETSYTGEVLSLAHLHRYHVPQPDRPFSDTVAALAHHPEHPPLFYLLARVWVSFWTRWFDSAVAVTRSLAMVFSVLTIPVCFCFARELFGSPRTAWISTALVAVSPLHVLYAHEARQYSLWGLTALLASWMLLRSLRSPTMRHWGLYSLSLMLGLYSHLFFVFVVAAHGIYVLAQPEFYGKQHRRAPFRGYVVANALAWVAFSPWIWIIVSKLGRTSEAIEEAERGVDFDFLLSRWFRNLNRIFVNGDLNDFNLLLVAFVLYALYVLVRCTPRSVWLLLLGLIASNSVVLMATDVLSGSVRSAGLRYLFVAYTGIQLSVAYFFSRQFAPPNKPQTRWTRVWQGLFLILLTAGIGGGVVNHLSEVTWNKSDDKARFYIPAAALVNAAENPRLLTEADPVQVLTFSYRFKPEVQVQLLRGDRLPDLSRERVGDRTLFLFSPSPRLMQHVASYPGVELEQVRNRKDRLQLWQVRREGG